MSLITLSIDSNASADSFKSDCNLAPGGSDAANNFVNYLTGLIGGALPGADLTFEVGPVQSTAEITSTGSASNDQTMTLCNVTLTGKTSGAVPADGEFNISATVGTQAANIAAAINAVPEFVGVVTATSLEGVTIVTSVVPGIVGNALQIVDVNLSNVTVAAFEGGTAGTSYSIDLGG